MWWNDVSATIIARTSTRTLPQSLRPYKAFANDVYLVILAREDTHIGEVTHLMIRRHDGGTLRSWSDLQEIKRDLGYADRAMVEIFPPDAKLVDFRNLYHLWVLPAGYELPFGRLHEVIPPVGI